MSITTQCAFPVQCCLLGADINRTGRLLQACACLDVVSYTDKYMCQPLSTICTRAAACCMIMQPLCKWWTPHHCVILHYKVFGDADPFNRKLHLWKLKFAVWTGIHCCSSNTITSGKQLQLDCTPAVWHACIEAIAQICTKSASKHQLSGGKQSKTSTHMLFFHETSSPVPKTVT